MTSIIVITSLDISQPLDIIASNYSPHIIASNDKHPRHYISRHLSASRHLATSPSLIVYCQHLSTSPSLKLFTGHGKCRQVLSQTLDLF